MLGEVHPSHPGVFSRLEQGLEKGGAVISLSAAGVQDLSPVRCVGQRQTGQGIPERVVIAPRQETVPGSGHGLVVSRVFGVELVGGEEMHIPSGGPVKAVAPGAEIAGVLPVQGLGAEGAAQETFHGIASFSMDEMGQRDTMVLTSSGGLSLMRAKAVSTWGSPWNRWVISGPGPPGRIGAGPGAFPSGPAPRGTHRPEWFCSPCRSHTAHWEWASPPGW